MISLLALILGLLSPSPAQAFPEMVRHGYANCTACHVSPSGFGLLNEYGRSMSKELLSHWAREGEERFAYGLVTPPERLLLQGYFRGLQLHRENASLREGRPILMQADFEAGYVFDNAAVVGTIGRQEYRDRAGTHEKIFSRGHYGLYRIGDEHHLRAGRFQMFYGLNDPNHFLATRRDLGFGQDTESYNAEYAFLGESWNFYLTGVFGGLNDERSLNQESGVSASASYFFGEKHKVGTSVFRGDSDTADRTVGGIWAIVSWFGNFYTLSEVDFQSRRSPAGVQRGYVTSHRFNYEVTKGVIPFFLLERSHLDRNVSANFRNGYGLGVQFFPRPHFELLGQWQRDEMARVSQSGIDRAWLMLNFYL